jgi:5-methyltetrahydropteroyltriglutamate--homocysteine methyltransferase
MYRSDDRILTSHVGSLPRPERIMRLMFKQQEGEQLADGETAEVRDAVIDAVRRQREAGVDIVNDGELGKVGFVNYACDRLEGLGPAEVTWSFFDLEEVPAVAERQYQSEGAQHINIPAVVGPLRYVGKEAAARDIATLKEGLAETGSEMAFMTAASPGILTWHMPNQHYPSYQDYVMAMADVMSEEYRMIADAGFVLQLDCPDIPCGNPNHVRFWATDVINEMGYPQFVELQLAALDRATKDIPPEQLRLHLCWGNYEGPHHFDVPLADVLRPVLKARPKTISFEAANPRHEHEWMALKTLRVPEDHVIIPGVINSVTNFVEHPEVVAQRLERFASVVDRDQIIAGTDCGFGTYVGFGDVAEAAVWRKLASLSEGAALASKRLWS